jgi:hypothetical protein
MWGTNVSPFLGLFLGLWIIDEYMDPSCIHSYEAVKKILQNPAEIGPKWLVKQAFDHATDEQCDF